MDTLLLVSFNPLSAEKLQQYAAAATPTLASFGAEIIVKGEATHLAGASNYAMRTVIAFKTREQAELWYKSPEYQAIIPLREQAMDAEFTLVG